ncbi:MAG: asparaginase [Acidimicrobiia bacterium]|nr:asparaginase [Acidimicrobiia bacterium]
MRFARVRSGLAESFDDVDAIALDANGRELFTSGNPDRPMYYRSAIKPFQALAARRTGLVLPPEHLALTCASHHGYPVHIAIVRQILSNAGITEASLRTTPDRPLARRANADLISKGDRSRRSILHNCSGKHAGWLAACVHTGWDLDTYLEPNHPIQTSIVEIVHEFTGINPLPVGVDGCGAPTLRGSIRGLAKAFIRLDTEEEMEPIADVMARFPSLITDNVAANGRIGAMWGGPQKGGAEGSYAMVRHGVAIATKSMSGDGDVACSAALHVADRLGMLTDAMRTTLDPQLNQPVMGAGRSVGNLVLVNA